MTAHRDNAVVISAPLELAAAAASPDPADGAPATAMAEKSGGEERTDDGVGPDPAIEFTPVLRRPFLYNVALLHGTLRPVDAP